MGDYLLDTNHAGTLVTLTNPLRHRVLQRLQRGDTFAITVPVVAETLFGIGLLPRAKQNVVEWSALRPNFVCYVPDEADAESAAALQRSLRRQGRQLETVDAFIAIVALRYQLVLLTTDKDFAAVPNLKCQNWFVP
ncbi:MAG TPA: type II toxin-antitoxin system VapC family toxin [Tepidisphaeraceae bacterium]|jgi:tRNA(fMet)-specific endonuclease VapC|nr:type II toxin-antitoxin system VapC family toxin [Tepidisphaeraceae bacterium]